MNDEGRLTLVLQDVIVRDDQRVRQPAELLDRRAKRERVASFVPLEALQGSLLMAQVTLVARRRASAL